MDWIRVSRTTDEAWVALGQGGGSFHFWTKYLPGVGSANANAHFFADLDGDGRADWIQISRTSNVVKLAFASLSGDFATWTMPAQQIGLSKAMSYFADVNGDGKADWITLSEYMMTANLSNGDGTFSAATSTSVWPAATCIFADVNGDKNQDAICSSEGPNKYVIYNFISKGDGTFKPQVRLGSYDGPVLMSDLNADGMADRISIVENGAAFFYWPTIPVQSPYPYPISLSAPSAPNLNYSSGIDYYFEDINGDGKPDLIIVDRANRNGFVGLNMLNNMYRITSIADPVHGTTTIEYKPVTDPSVYTSDTDGVYPLRDAIFPLPNPTARMPFVVSAVTSPDGKGGTLTTRYTYGGMKTDVLRNQNLGFRWMKATQVESGISTYTEFKQVWPYTGLVASTTTTGPSGSLLNQVINTYGCTDFVSTSGCTVTPGRRYFPFLSQSVVSAWDAKGIALPTTTITKKYDSFGNVTREVTSSSDGYSKTVDTEYMNDINKWWIGRPVRETVTNTSP
ncbi:hypothetical protein E4K72_02095 [Oxalobacteraceae bacterium OM1]|nr:hypothetical protein E4K72_02095 [Oxalobacteraceae bacterium OM1]